MNHLQQTYKGKRELIGQIHRPTLTHVVLLYGVTSCCCPSLLVNFKEVVGPLARI